MIAMHAKYQLNMFYSLDVIYERIGWRIDILFYNIGILSNILGR